MTEKLFVQYPGLRSSTRRFDPCVKQGVRTGNCRDCKTFVTSDRFLGGGRQVKLVGSIRKFPYVIIADTAGCNLRCWFCYSHHFWKPEKRCAPVFLSPDGIVNQLKCKIEKICEAEGQVDRKPFTSIRVSGREPIYADTRTLQPYESDTKVDYTLGINFWLSFFEKLDSLIGELKKNNNINIVLESEWDKDLIWPWPTFVSDAKDRVYLRFDTNGIAFGDNREAERVLGGKENAKYLISGLCNLYKVGKLNHVKVWITYSLKGVCPNEYYWSQRRNLPSTEENEDYEFKLEEHPQYSGYKSLREEINKQIKGEAGFKDCVDITVEKGINHDLEHSVYVYNPEAFRWDILEEKFGIRLSDVENDMCVIYTFGGGPWGLGKITPSLIKRYFNQGAEIVVSSELGEGQYSDTYEQARMATNWIGIRHAQEHFRVIIRPKTTRITSERRAQPPEISSKDSKPVFGWVLSGSPPNWEVAFVRNIWGVRPKHEILWERMKTGDPLFLYATRPVSSLIGIARVIRTIKENRPYWPDEIRLGRAKYPFRIEFEPVKILPKPEWGRTRMPISHLGEIYFQGINPIEDKELFTKLEKIINDKLNG